MTISLDLDGTTALVLGASGGIGGAIARRFAQAGAAVVLHSHRSPRATEELRDQITSGGGEALVATADLTEPAAVQELVGTTTAWTGRIDSVVNAAGTQPLQDLASMSVDEWREVADTVSTSSFLVTQAAAAAMAGRGGSVTHIASIEGSQPARAHGHYNAAKAALIMHARSAALEFGAAGVRVNTVSPGLVARPGLAEQWPEGVRRWHDAAPLGRLVEGEDVANMCAYLASPLARSITGQDHVVDAGVSTHPTW